MQRQAQVERKTRETEIACQVNLDGRGNHDITTEIGFFSHMLETLSKHSLVDISLTLKGDLEVDQHHSVEDAGLVIGECLNKALGNKAGINRNGFCLFPMDEVLARCALDLSGRAGTTFNANFEHRFIGELESTMVKEFFHALMSKLEATCHLEIITAGNDHHMAEALFKAFAKSLKQAVSFDPRIEGDVPSTKGAL